MDSTQTLPENRIAGNTCQLSLQGQYYPDTNTRENITEKENYRPVFLMTLMYLAKTLAD